MVCTKHRILWIGLAGIALLACGDSSPSSPDTGTDAAQCAVGQTFCTDRCVDTQTHPENCGACGTKCASGELCENGSCVSGTACSAGNDAGVCGTGECCGPAGDICCPQGTVCASNVPTFFGCCPVGQECGCIGPMCPVSRRQAKRDIHYLLPAELTHYYRELLNMRLARYRYKAGSGDPRTHLGFIMEDIEPSVAADSQRGVVDLYSYTSMTVAALQVQAAQIKALQAQVAALKRRLAKRNP